MTMAEALQQMDELPYAWTIGKGRVRMKEPLWGVQVFRVVDGIARTEQPAFVVEGDSLDHCVARVVAWHEKKVVV